VIVRSFLCAIVMLTLYSYPDLSGVADYNPFGLQVFALNRRNAIEDRGNNIVDLHVYRVEQDYMSAVASMPTRTTARPRKSGIYPR
jgi:hypothetical protein